MIKLKVDGSGVFKKIGRALESLVDVRGNLAAERLQEALVLNTPIRTGYARSRWTLKQEDAYVVRYSFSRPALFGEFNYTISNDAPYIKRLNAGSSKQAPAFFIESTILSQGFTINGAVTIR